MAPHRLVCLEHTPPDAGLPIESFREVDPERRERATLWAYGVLASPAMSGDDALLAAAKTIRANMTGDADNPDRFSFAISIIEGLEARRAV